MEELEKKSNETLEARKDETAKDNDKGDKPKTTPLIADADKAAEKLEAANQKREEILDREEKLLARRALSGKAQAGTAVESQDSKDQKEADERVKQFS